MGDSREPGQDTTHDWAADVDIEHLDGIGRSPAVYAPGGVDHLILEVLAYAAEEAECGPGGRCVVVLHPDGSVSVADDGRGTETRAGAGGPVVRKPVMATRDLRFFGVPGREVLPDGHPRRGMSVVAALSEWLVHTNRRQDGAWTQRYERGIPVTGLLPVPGDGTTGTTVRFRPAGVLLAPGRYSPAVRERLAGFWPQLTVVIEDARAA
ncbi:ATP-binding protein [Amycolatopsis antarctica]|uniref:DNA topoisomerase (ATP-hydrolyzing) n=1 Tax=Amycolatopsis antarctica TaxID=1854586 RepID=A0A263D1E0_9PSEU|nr:ATP-binding protein [Amycolatopsis antarctica]OZM72009.1 ATP-binding protein [Amycolatopsis antarctica]